MRRVALLLTGGALWLILAALPALADGGPHTSTINNGSAGINADSCAGCHRAHTAQGPFLIKEATEEELCLSCHGAAVPGSTIDVETGMQYRLGTGVYQRSGDYDTPGDPQTPWVNGTQLGATRGGGFVLARLGDAARVATSTGGGLRSRVPVGTTQPVTSAHLDLDGVGGVVANGIAWGNGLNGSGPGPAVELTCASCHNPHGNGQYRILNAIPAPVDLDGTFDATVAITIDSIDATANLFTTVQGHNLSVGDIVTIRNTSDSNLNKEWTVVEVPNGISFKVNTSLQAASTAISIASSDATTNAFTTSVAHGLLVGDLVTIAGHTGSTPSANSTFYVQSVTATEFTVYARAGSPAAPQTSGAIFDLAVGGSGGTVTKSGTFAPAFDITGSPTGGTVEWARFPVADGPAVPVGDTRNYTVIQRPGTQGTDTSYLLFASQVAGTGSHRDVIGIVSSDATTNAFTTASNHGFSVGNTVTVEFHNATVSVSGAATNSSGVITSTVASETPTTFTLTNVDVTTGGTNVGVATRTYTAAYAPTDGDYFHRTTPWYYTSGQADDAPNGQPATNPSTAVGDVAFNAQITTWCSSCHTRYFANQNPNPGSLPGSSAASTRYIIVATASNDTLQTTVAHGFLVGDTVAIAGNGSVANGTYTVETVPTSLTFTLAGVNIVSDGIWALPNLSDPLAPVTPGGTAVRTNAPQAQSTWWFPRPGDTTFSYQHRTVPNRACTTCHVSHGSNATMTPGGYSATVAYPDGTESASSRLLKIDNRGTCQACHDPTGTIPAGTYSNLPQVTP